MIRLFFGKNWHFFLLALIAFFPFLVTQNKEFSFFFGLEYYDFPNFFFTWINKDLGVIPGNFFPVNFVYYFLVQSLGHFWGSVVVWEFLYILGFAGVIFAFRAVSFFYGKMYEQKSNQPVEFLIGLFYIVAIPGQLLPSMPFAFNLAYAVFPWIIFFSFRFATNNGRDILKYASLLSLILFLGLGMQIVFLIFIFLAWILLLIFFILVQKLSAQKCINLFLITIIFYGIFSLPYYYITAYLPMTTQQELVEQVLSIENPSFTQSDSFLTEIYKIMGSTSYYYYHKGEYSIPSVVPYFKNSFFIILSYFGIIVFFFFSLVSFAGIHKKISIYLSLLFLVAAFFMSGVHNAPPLDKIYFYIYEKTPLFQMFRNGYKAYFLLLFVFSISLGFFIQKLKSIFGDFATKSLYYAIFILLLIFFRPMYDQSFYKFLDVQIPEGTEMAFEYINANFDRERFLVVPLTPFPGYSFASRGVDVFEFPSNMQAVTRVDSAGVAAKILKEMELFEDKEEINVFKAKLQEMNIHYILWSKDVNSQQYDMDSSEDILPFYENNFEELIRWNDRIIIFKVL